MLGYGVVSQPQASYRRPNRPARDNPTRRDHPTQGDLHANSRRAVRRCRRASPIPAAAVAVQGDRPDAGACRTVLRANPGGLGRRRDPGRAASRRSRVQRNTRQPRRLGFPEPAPQQARHRAEPENRRGPRSPDAPCRAGRRHRREHAARRHRKARGRFRAGQEAQPAHHLRQHFRLRPIRPLCRAAVDRSGSAGHERDHVGDGHCPARVRSGSASPSPTSWRARSWRRAS